MKNKTKRRICLCNGCGGNLSVSLSRRCVSCGHERFWTWNIDDLLGFIVTGWMSSCTECGQYWRCYLRNCTISDMDLVMDVANAQGLGGQLTHHLQGLDAV